MSPSNPKAAYWKARCRKLEQLLEIPRCTSLKCPECQSIIIVNIPPPTRQKKQKTPA